MRFLVAECTGPAVAKWLQSSHHDVRRVLESYLDKLANNFIIVTDKTVRIVEGRRDKLGGSGV